MKKKTIDKRLLKSTYKSLTLDEQMLLIVMQNASLCNASVTTISKETLATRLEVDVRTITNRLNSLEQKGFIEKLGSGWKINPQEHWEFYCPEAINQINLKELAFANRLAACRITGTTRIELTKKELIERTEVPRCTFMKLYKSLVEKEVLLPYKKGVELIPEYWPVTRPYLSPALRNQAKELLEVSYSETFYLGARVWRYYWSKGFEGLKMKPDDLLQYCIANCPGMNSEKVKVFGDYEIPAQWEF